MRSVTAKSFLAGGNTAMATIGKIAKEFQQVFKSHGG
jgi:hypothetical protein